MNASEREAERQPRERQRCNRHADKLELTEEREGMKE